MAHKGAFHQVFVPFAAVSLWTFPLLILTTRYPRLGILGVQFLEHALTLSRIPLLFLGLLPLFALLWILGGAFSRFSKAVFLAVVRIYAWAFSLMELLDWQTASWIGEILSVFIALPFYFFFGGLLIAVLMMTWPINATLAVVLLVLITTAGLISDATKKGDEKSQYLLVLDVVRAAMAPIAFGMFGVFWMQLLVNVFDTDSDRIRKIENSLAYASAAAHDWVSFSIIGSVGLAAGLIVLVVLVPQLQAATRLLSLKSWGTKAAACLVCFSSFTFFSQVPYKYLDRQELKRIQAEKRTQDPESRKTALAEAYLIVKNLSVSDTQYYRGMFEEVNDTVSYGDQGQIIEAIAKSRVMSTSPEGKPRTLKVVTLPDNLFSKSKSGRKDQALEVIQDLFSTLIGAATPEIHGLAGKFIEEFVDQESERLFEKNIRSALNEGFDQIALEAAGEKLAAMETQDIDRNTQHSEIESIRSELIIAHQEISETTRKHEEQERAEHPVEEEVP
jgi:hypothetical protein